MDFQEFKPNLRIALCQIPTFTPVSSIRDEIFGLYLDGLEPDLVDLICLPEMAFSGFEYKNLASAADRFEGYIEQMAELAADFGAALNATLVCKEGGKFYNRNVIVTPAGIQGFYDKIHLIGFGGFRESKYFEPGQAGTTVSIFGWQIGLATCYDLRFPELFRGYTQSDLVSIPSQWPSTRQAHFEVLLQARAIENLQYYVMANSTGQSGKLEFTGGSAVIAPAGKTIAHFGPETKWQTFDLDHASIAQARQDFPVLEDRRL